MKSSADFSEVDLLNDQNFFKRLQHLSESHTISELWNGLASKVDITSRETALACADIAMCAGDKEEAFRRYEDWLKTCQGHDGFLPFTRSRIAARTVIEPVLPSFFNMVSEDGLINKLIGVGALFSLGRWVTIDELCDGRDQIKDVAWQIAAAVGFAKASNYDYTNASAFFIPALIQGYGLAVPHNGLNDSIQQAAEECARYARDYSYAARFAERSLISSGFERRQTAAPLHPAKIDLFIKTCAKDEEFLAYCLRSIDMFVSGFRRVIIVTDEGHNCSFDLNYDHKVYKIMVPSATKTFHMAAGYRMQMVVKLCWMDYTDADAVVITDSDTIFTRPFNPEQMFINEKPIWYYGPWSSGLSWRSGSELVVGAPMPFCCMREHPFIFTKDATEGFLEYIKCRFNCSVFDLFFAGRIPGRFCEFEILGGYLSHVSSHGYEVVEHKYRGIVRQYWSWGGFTEEVKTNIEQHLRTGAESHLNRTKA